MERPTQWIYNKNKVTTQLDNKALKREYINRILMARFMIDTNKSLDPITTVVKRHENYYVHFFISFKDSVVTVYDRERNLGLNGTAMGQQPAAHNISWTPIKFNGKDWDIMSIISGNIPNSKKQYNWNI